MRLLFHAGGFWDPEGVRRLPLAVLLLPIVVPIAPILDSLTGPVPAQSSGS